MNKFAAFDIDGTIFRSGLYVEIVEELLGRGKLDPSVGPKLMKLEKSWKNREHADAYRQFLNAMVAGLDGKITAVKSADFDQAVDTVFNNFADQVYVYTRSLAKKFKAEGYKLIAISGSQIEIVERFAKKYGFDIWVGTTYERDEKGNFTGKITATHKGKDVILKDLIEKHDLTFVDSVAIGDSEGDVGMLEIVDRPIVFNPEKQLFDIAKNQGWEIVIERKNVIYELKPDGKSYILA